MKIPGDADRVTALRVAYANGYVHRDVSEPNIVLFRPSAGDIRHGYLIDWEFAIKISKGQLREARDHRRTVSLSRFSRRHNILSACFFVSPPQQGTDAFVSARILSAKRRMPPPHSLQDDMESLVLVLLYCSLFWLKYKIKKVAEANINEFFEGKGSKPTTMTSTDGMREFLWDVGFRGGKVRPIREWLVEVFDDIKKFYSARTFYEDDGLPLPVERMWHLVQLKESLKKFCQKNCLESILCANAFMVYVLVN